MSSPVTLCPPVASAAPLGTSPSPTRVRGLRRIAVSVLALFGVMTSLFVTAGPASATLPARTTLENHIAWVVKNLIVTERALNGVPYIYMNANLMLSARRHNVAMAKANTMSHQLPGEPYFGTRMTQAGYYWSYAGENIAWNSSMTETGAVAVQKMMYNEKAPYDGHRLNILNRHFVHVGVDVYLDAVHHKLWLTVDFGHKR
jgi:uncharacterized protein YkwD